MDRENCKDCIYNGGGKGCYLERTYAKYLERMRTQKICVDKCIGVDAMALEMKMRRENCRRNFILE